MNCRDFVSETKYSSIEEEFPDEEKYPMYYKASKKEYIINEGEMLYIPAGWFHFVFSEEPNITSNVNFAVNFWYDAKKNWVEGANNGDLPLIKNHSLPNISIKKLLGDKELTLHRSKLKFFPPDLLMHRYKDYLKIEHMSYDDFLRSRNPQYYILQNECTELSIFAPKESTPLWKTSIWINFGHTYSLMHYDLKDNWLCQVQGRKRVLLFPPEERSKLYMRNPYPIDIIRQLEHAMEPDRFIRRNEKAFNPERFNLIMDSFPRESKAYNEYLLYHKCAVPNHDPPRNIRIIEVLDSDYTAMSYDFPITYIWFMTPTTLIIRNIKFDVSAGELFIFPMSFTYPWLVQYPAKFALLSKE